MKIEKMFHSEEGADYWKLLTQDRLLLWPAFCNKGLAASLKIQNSQLRKEGFMPRVLRLQKLTPTAVLSEMNVLLMSTYSGICPTTAATDQTGQFQME